MNSQTPIGRRPLIAACASWMAAPWVLAQTGPYPSRPVKMVVGYAPASGADVVARLISNKLADALKQGVTVENKPGAGGVILAQEFVRSPADGYTLMLAAMPQMVISPLTSSRIQYHVLKDFAPVAQVVSVDLVLITNPQKVPATNLKEFMAWSQKQAVNFFGTPGPGTVGHFLSSMFAETAKAKVEPVHFKATGDSVTALLSGEIHALFVTYTVAASLAKAGKVRALAVTSQTRSPLFPETPTVKEAGYADLEAGSWYGVFSPVSTPLDVLNKLSNEIVKAAKAPETKAKFEEAGMSVTALGREDFSNALKTDLARWERVVKATNFSITD